jgi:cytochrome P450
MAKQLPSASLAESLQFNQTVVVPNAVQGLFRRRPGPVGVATRLDVDGRGVRLIAGLRRRHGPGPMWIRVMADRVLLVLEVQDIHKVLDGAPHPFAADPQAKRRGMSAFQPDALTLSRGELWANRRRFNEAVLDTRRRVHRQGDRFVAVAREEVSALLDERLDYDRLHRVFRRIVRRVVLGDEARDDEELSDLLAQLMSAGNSLPKQRPPQFEPFMRRLRSYVAAGARGSLVGRVARAPHDQDTRVEGQVPHWLFAMQDTLSANVLRALAAIVSHPKQRDTVEAELEAARNGVPEASTVAGMRYLAACLQEAMRLWPTTPLLSRETLAELVWDGVRVPAGTQVMIPNTFHHRDRERVPYADRFAPEQWTQGDAGEQWKFNHLSHGPQGCPGANLAVLMGTAVLAELLSGRRPRLLEPSLDPDRPLPHMLNVFGLRFALERLSA